MSSEARRLVKKLLEDDEPSHFETTHSVRASTADRLNARLATFAPKGSVTTSSRSGTFHRDDAGNWTRTRKVRNQKYWNQEIYGVAVDARSKEMRGVRLAFPRNLAQAHWRRALYRLLRELNFPRTGNDGLVIEGMDKRDFESDRQKWPRYRYRDGFFRPV